MEMEKRRENTRLSFGYEDTDKKIEIELYGLVFEIRNIDNLEELSKLDKNNKNDIKAQLEKILGEGAVDKINKKRKEDGYKELDTSIELNILGCIFETYAKSLTNNTLKKVINVAKEVGTTMNEFNRGQRGSYNRNQQRRGRRNYRRY